MQQLIIIRHGMSEGNNNGVIQGNREEYHLTETGKKNTRLTVDENLERLQFAQKIVSSKSNRAKETASIIAEQLQLPIIEDSTINEVAVGILTGMSKKEANRIYPSYYKIWDEKKDLDQIPEAEKGEELQARVMGFLMQYYDKEEFCDIVVSHSGFIRCLINTIEGRERTSQIDVKNNSIFIMENIFDKMLMEERKRAMNSRVFIINTGNGKYVVKMKKGHIGIEDYAEQCLLDNMFCEGIPRILSMQNYENDTFCKIVKYVEGEHTYGQLGEKEYKALLESEERLSKMLTRVKGASQFFKTADLEKEISMIYQQTDNMYIKEMAKSLLESDYSLEFRNGEKVLSHNDINRDNILFETKKNGEVKANIIDFESLEMAPKDFQFASMLASGLLLEGESIKRIKETIQKSGKDYGKILYFMQVRLLKGLHFFQQRVNGTPENKSISIVLRKKYFLANELLRREIENIHIKDNERE